MKNLGKKLRGLILNYRYNSLLKHAFRTILIGVASPLMAVIVSIYLFSQNILNREIEVANLRTLDTVENVANTLVNGAITASLRISADEDIAVQLRMHPPEVYADFERVRRIMDRLELSRKDTFADSVYLYDMNSHYLITNVAYASRMDYAYDTNFLDYLAAVPENGIFWTRREMLPQFLSNTIPALTMFRQISGAQFHGFAVINIYESTLLELFGNSRENGSEGTVLLIDESGTALFDVLGHLSGGRIDEAFDEETVSQLMSGGRGVCPLNYMHERSMAAFMRMDNGWTLVKIVPYHTYASSLVALRAFVLGSLLLGLVISLVVAAILGARLHRPIEEIVNFIDRRRSEDGTVADDELNYILMHLVSLYDENKLLEREKLDRYTALRSAQAQALQAQITPHFLHNTLQTISFMVLKSTKNERDPSIRALVMLADMARVTMEDIGNITTLAQEISYVKNYIELQRLRYRDAFEYTACVPNELMEAHIPRMCLQPLVENAIEHALKSRDGHGTIAISTQSINDVILISVEDDGVGMETADIEKLNESFRSDDGPFVRHIGLGNVNLRIRLLFGEAYGLTVAPSEKGGICTMVSLPLPNKSE